MDLAAPDVADPAPVRQLDIVSSGAFIFRKLVWTAALIALVLAAVNGFMTFSAQTSAPQQAAAAGNACFQMIVPYVLARALDELTRSECIRIAKE